MEVIETSAGGTTTLRIVGRVDSSVSEQLEQKVLAVVSRDDRIVLDLRDTNYVSSAGLRSFILFAKHAHSRNRMIALCGIHEEIAEIFDLAGLLQLFTIYDSPEAAVAAPQ